MKNRIYGLQYLPFSGALDVDSAVLAISIATAMNY